jgi:hypothetical protein
MAIIILMSAFHLAKPPPPLELFNTIQVSNNAGGHHRRIK